MGPGDCWGLHAVQQVNCYDHRVFKPFKSLKDYPPVPDPVPGGSWDTSLLAWPLMCA